MTIWTEAPTAAFLALDAKTTATPLGILKEDGLAKLIEAFGDKINLYAELLTDTGQALLARRQCWPY